MSLGKPDIEKEPSTVIRGSPDDSESESYEAGRQVTHFEGVANSGVFARLRHWEGVLDRKLGVESHGPDRVLADARTNPPPVWIMFALWASGTMNLSCFATGFIGFEIGLSLKQSMLVTIFGTFLGSCVTGWCATLGAPTGLRQVSISRYSLGWWPAKLIAILNAIEQIGWSSVGCITGGLALTAVSDGRISSALGVVIIALCGMIFSFIGLRAVFKYEQFAWMVFLVIFLVMYGEAAKYATDFNPNQISGMTLSGNCLTLFAIVYGSSASWSSIVSDYYVQYPTNISKHKVFWLTTLGICLPTCIGMLMGCCVASALGYNKEWADQYETGLGYLIQTFLYPLGFAKFILVVLVLSGIGMNCIAIYSGALSIQQFARPLQAVPRFFWTLLLFVIILLLGLVGRDQLITLLSNFLSLLGYWNTAFFVIVFTEHFLFRRGDIANYNLEAWNTRELMPIGIAGGCAFAMGIVGCVLGMVQSDYVGVIAAKIGEEGGDIGNELAFVFTLVTYIPLRFWERKQIGR